MQTKTEPEKALAKAKIQLMSKADSAFYSSICFSLKHEFDDSIPTAATDGKNIKYNTEFFMGLKPEERVFLLLHETMHCAYQHMFRAKQQKLDHRKFNVAADHVINLQLIDAGFSMPRDGLADPKYKGLNAEQVYKLLPESDEKAPMEDLLEGDPGDAKECAEAMQDILVRAAMQSKMANDKPGTIPQDIEIFLNKLLKPKLPWTVVLRRYLQELAKADYSWSKPNKRYLPTYYLPSLHSKNMMEIAIAIDTSGSVTDEQFTQFISEVHSVMKVLQPPKITLIQFDSTIKAINEVKSIKDLLQVKFTGRGGTLIHPVIEWANTNKPKLLMVFTDGDFRSSTSSKVNTLWLIHNNPKWKAPFGKAIHYELA